MTIHASQPNVDALASAGLPGGDIAAWRQALPARTTDFASDRRAFAAYWQSTARLIEKLPPKAKRNDAERAAAKTLHEAARAARVKFLRAHVDAAYDALTDNRAKFVRLQHLVTAAADAAPGLVPSAQQIAAEDGLLQSEKDGLEIDQGLFVSAVLRSERSGRHLCHAMLLARPEAEALLPQFVRDGTVALPGASIERAGRAALVTLKNPRFLN